MLILMFSGAHSDTGKSGGGAKVAFVSLNKAASSSFITSYSRSSSSFITGFNKVPRFYGAGEAGARFFIYGRVFYGRAACFDKVKIPRG